MPKTPAGPPKDQRSDWPANLPVQEGVPPLRQDPNRPYTMIQVGPETEVYRMDTEDEGDSKMIDVHHNEPITEPPAEARGNWPSMLPEDVAEQRRRTAKKQVRRALEHAALARQSGVSLGNASKRAISDSARFPPLHRTDEAAALTSASSSSRPVPQLPMSKAAPV